MAGRIKLCLANVSSSQQMLTYGSVAMFDQIVQSVSDHDMFKFSQQMRVRIMGL